MNSSGGLDFSPGRHTSRLPGTAPWQRCARTGSPRTRGCRPRRFGASLRVLVFAVVVFLFFVFFWGGGGLFDVFVCCLIHIF